MATSSAPGAPPPPPPPPPGPAKKFVDVVVQLARTDAGRALGEHYVFFEYPAGLDAQRDRAHTVKLRLESKALSLNSSNEQRSLINATTLAGFGRDFAAFSLYWGKHFADDIDGLRAWLRPWHKVNHLPASHLLSHKDFLARQMARLARQFPDAYGSVAPQAFVLPDDKLALAAALDAEPDSLWIEKPYASSRGRGITVWAARDKDKLLHQVSQPRPELHPDLQNTAIKLKPPPDPSAVVVQRYLARPYLLDGLKFDLRIYVAATSFDPL
jgi:hypothetical protein